jgi:hypothetical protein
MNRLMLIIILLCLPCLSEAQPELSLSLKAGPNAAIWDREHHEHKYGFSGGLASDLRWPFGTRFSLGAQMALLYTPRGTESIDPFTGMFLGTWRQRYFDIAVAFRSAARVGPTNLYLLLGGGWNLLLRATRESVNTPGWKEDVTEGFSRHDLTLLVGAGVSVRLPSKKLGPFRLGTVFLEARYDRGLLDFVRADDSSAKNRTTSLMLGVSLALGTRRLSRDQAIQNSPHAVRR